METTLRRWCWCAPLLGKQLPDRGCIQPGLRRACLKISYNENTSKRRIFLSLNLIFSVNQGVSAETSQPGEILLLLILIPMIKSRQSLRLQSGWKQPWSIFVCGCFDNVRIWNAWMSIEWKLFTLIAKILTLLSTSDCGCLGERVMKFKKEYSISMST